MRTQITAERTRNHFPKLAARDLFVSSEVHGFYEHAVQIHLRAAKYRGLRNNTTREGFCAELVEIPAVVARRPSQSSRDGFALCDESHVFGRQFPFVIHGSGAFVHGIVVLFGCRDYFPRRDPHVVFGITIEHDHDGFPTIRARTDFPHATKVIDAAIDRHDPARFVFRIDALKVHNDATSAVPRFLIDFLVLRPW